MIKILLAEDTSDLNRALTVVLQHEGYSVDSVFDGEEALEHLRSDAYDTVILDIMMPKADGLEVLSRMPAAFNTQAKNCVSATSPSMRSALSCTPKTPYGSPAKNSRSCICSCRIPLTPSIHPISSSMSGQGMKTQAMKLSGSTSAICATS